MSKKTFLILLAIIILLGLFIRLTEYAQYPYGGDTKAVLTTAVMWFYPHEPFQVQLPDKTITTSFPGLFDQGEPPVGHIIIGAGCMLSGEDFSNVRDASPMYYPNRPRLLGQQFTNAKPYCDAPIYLFGILTFLTLILLTYLLTSSKLSTLFGASFFAFYPALLDFSRQMHVDVISWFFITLTLIFLYLAFKEEKYSKNEKIFSIAAAISVALAVASKFSAGLMLFLAAALFIKKYKPEILNLIRKSEIDKNLVKLVITLIIIFTIAFLAPFQFSPENVVNTYKKFNSHNPGDSSFGLNWNILDNLNSTFLIHINILDLLLLTISLYIIYKLIRKTEKTSSETFILYSLSFLLIGYLFSNAFHLARIATPYLFIVPITMSLIFSGQYTIGEKLKVGKYFTIFIIIYLLLAFTTAYASKPDFQVKNPLTCHLSAVGCKIKYSEESATKELVSFLKQNLKEKETAIGDLTETFYFEMEQSQAEQNYLFDIAFQQQTGKPPTLIEKMLYFKPDNKTVKYIILSAGNTEKEAEEIRRVHKPIKTISYKNQQTYEIYDLRKDEGYSSYTSV